MFASLFKAEDRSPWGDFWFQPVGGRSVAGMQVTPDSAMRVSAVFACVRELAQSFAVLPVDFYQQKGRKRVQVTNHPLYKLLRKRPNRWQNAYEWREMVQGHISLRGNAYNYISANSRGVIKELIPLHPDRIKPIIKSDGDYNWQYTRLDGTIVTYAREEIWHIKGLAPDIYRGYSPIALARDSVGTALAAQEYGARFFANDAKPSGGWIEHQGTFKSPEAKKLFRESWQEMQSGANRGKTAILEGGMKYHEIGISNADAQFLETRKFSIEDIARMFGVPPHRIGHLERSTNNNIEHQGLEFVTYTMMPIAERWEASIEAELLFEDDETEIEFGFSRLLRGDSKARSMYYHNGILDGWMTRNEARAMENMNPLDGLDEPLRPLNMMPESEADEEEDEMKGDGVDKGKGGEQDE
jgi:HK97 family phage portal protein